MQPKPKTSPLSRIESIIGRQGEPRYQKLAEQLEEACFLVTPRPGLFLYANHKGVELTGYARTDLERLGLSELFPAPEAAEALETIRAVEPGATRQLQNVPLRTRTGKIVYVDLKLSGLAGDELLVMILARDSAVREDAEREFDRQRQTLVAQDELISLLLQPKPDTLAQAVSLCQGLLHAQGVALYYSSSEPPGLRLVQAANWPDEFPGLLEATDPVSMGTQIHWRSGDRPASALTRAARTRGWSSLHTHPVGSGTLVAGYHPPKLQPPEVTRLMGMAARALLAVQSELRRNQKLIDTERRANDTQLRLETLLDNIDEGVLQINHDGRILATNHAVESLLGYHAHDILNAPLEDALVSPQPLVAPILAALRQDKAWGPVDTDLVRRDGSTVAVLVRAAPTATQRNKLHGGLVLLTDRTDVRQFQNQSDHLERRAWLGDLSAIFAHDVRNPLNGISTGLSYLATKSEPGDPLAEAVGKMQAEVTRIDQLLKNVLLVAKSAEINYRPVSLKELLDRTLTRWRPRLMRYNIQLSYEADPATPLAMADANQIDQVFTNLIVNAVDAIRAKVEQAKENKSEDGAGNMLSIMCHPANHPSAPRGNFVELLFSDTGLGIEAEKIPRVFDPFFTTKPDGTGLGLAITKRIVTAHKGTIHVESWPGIGTAFHVFIPVAEENT
jgi:PAS domain S-box-containing protein